MRDEDGTEGISSVESVERDEGRDGERQRESGEKPSVLGSGRSSRFRLFGWGKMNVKSARNEMGAIAIVVSLRREGGWSVW